MSRGIQKKIPGKAYLRMSLSLAAPWYTRTLKVPLRTCRRTSPSHWPSRVAGHTTNVPVDGTKENLDAPASIFFVLSLPKSNIKF